jgi:chorismate dehydratase
MLASKLQPTDSDRSVSGSPAPLDPPLRVCAVSFLNTTPLTWGFERNPSSKLEVTTAIPSVCAEQLRSGKAEIGLVPVAEIARQGLSLLKPSLGIASEGEVRSILLFSRKPWSEVRTLAGDTSSRSSVVLAQILLRECFGVTVELYPEAPDLRAMLSRHDAAIIIGDPALQIEPAQLPYHCLDLGEVWTQHTGFPMVFAAWAGSEDAVRRTDGAAFVESLALGLANLDAIVEKEAPPRSIPIPLARRYLSKNIRFELGPRELEGMREFLSRADKYGLLALPKDMATRQEQLSL